MADPMHSKASGQRRRAIVEDLDKLTLILQGSFGRNIPRTLNGLKDNTQTIDIRLQNQGGLFIRMCPTVIGYEVHHNDPYKLSVDDYLCTVRSLMARDVSVKTEGRALGLVQDVFRPLELALTIAEQTSGEGSYKTLFQIIELEEGSMSGMCPAKAVTFYKLMGEAASREGTPMEQAFLQGLYGTALIQHKGDQLSYGVKLVKDALKKLTTHIYHRVVLMVNLGLMFSRLGDNSGAEKVLMEASHLCDRIPRERQSMVERHKIQIQSYLAIVHIYGGNYTEANRILECTTPHAHRLMAGHLVNAVLVQSLGINAFRLEEYEKADVYYRNSAVLRKVLKQTLPFCLVTTLNNQAYQCILEKNLDEAFNKINTALNIRRNLGWKDYTTGLSLWYRGIAYLYSFQATESVMSCEQAKEILSFCTPQHMANIAVRFVKAHAYMLLGKRQKAVEELLETLKYEADFQLNWYDMSYLDVLEHLVLMIEQVPVFEEIHKRLIGEAKRLLEKTKIYMEREDHGNISDSFYLRKYISLQRKLASWHVYLGEVLCTDESQKEETWNSRFTCQHCKRLGMNYSHWRQTSF